MGLLDGIVKNLLLISPALAADTPNSAAPQSGLVVLAEALYQLILEIQNIALISAWSIIVLMLVIGGTQYLMGQADAGKKTITAAIIGSVIIIMSAVILYSFVQLMSVAK